ncbi:MAG: hypothetical protein ACRD2W_24685 [Acidimicrobiales bacterium]
MMSIAAFVRLTELVQPPDFPVRANGDWKRFVSTNGFWPPEDYRMLVREYGSGLFADWLYLIEPFDPSISFTELVAAECRTLRNSSQRGPLWPEPGGFLPWAKTVTADHIGWRTDGRPENWTTVFWGHGGQAVSEYPVSTVGFVLAVVERSLGPVAVNGSSANPWPTVSTASFQAAQG